MAWATLGAGVLVTLAQWPGGRSGRVLSQAGLVLLVGAVYLRTLSPTTDIGDSFEWVIIARDLGIGHGPGYPLYVLIAKLFTLLPWQDLAWRLNLLSASAATLAVWVAYLLAARLSGSPVAGLSAALALAFSTAFWSQALIAEIYTLQVLLVLATLYGLLRWLERAAEPAAWRWLVATSFFLGLALVQHLSNLFLVPIVALAVGVNAPRALYRPRRLATLAGAFLLGLAPLFYFPWRWPAVYGRQVAAAELFGYLSGSDYRRLFFPERLLADPSRFQLYPFELAQQYVWPLLLLAGLGFLWLLRYRRQWALWLGLLYLMYSGARLMYYVWDGWVIQTPAHALVALALAAGLAAVAAWLAKRWAGARGAWLTGAWWALVVLLLAGQLWAHGPDVDMSAGWAGYAAARRALDQALPPGAALVTDPDLGSGLLYAQHVEGHRPDVLVIFGDTREGRDALLDPEALDRPLYTLDRLPPETGNRPLRSLGPLIEVAGEPLWEPPAGFTPPGGAWVQAPTRPPAPGPEPTTATSATVAPLSGPTLLGYQVEGGGAPLLPGQQRGLTLLWRGGETAEDLRVGLALVDAAGRRFAGPAARPVAGRYPFPAWRRGEYVTDYQPLPVDWQMPPGRYELELRLEDDRGQTVASRPGLATLELGAATEHEHPRPELPLARSWPDGPELLGCDGCGPLRVGLPAQLRLYWRAPLGRATQAVSVTLDAGPAGSSTVALPALAPGQVLASDHPLTLTESLPGTLRPELRLSPAGRRAAYRLPPLAVRSGTPGLAGPVPFADGLVLAGVGKPAVLRPGQRAWLRLDWEALARPRRRYTAYVHVLDAANERRAGTDREILHAARPTWDWRPGERVSDWLPLDLPAELPAGGYQLLVGLYDQATKAGLAVLEADGRPGTGRALVPVLVDRPDKATPARALGARFGDEIALLGATVGAGESSGGDGDSSARVGGHLPLSLRWRALRPPAADYTVFAHLIREGRLIAQYDGQPFGGALPTGAWPPGQDIDLELAIPLPDDLVPGPVEIHLGLYELASGRRLAVTGAGAELAGDHVVLPARLP